MSKLASWESLMEAPAADSRSTPPPRSGAAAKPPGASSRIVPWEELVGEKKAAGKEEKPFGADLPFITEYVTKGQVDPKTGKEVREGFFANLKNPLHLWMKESLPANVYSYLTNRKELERKALIAQTEEA